MSKQATRPQLLAAYRFMIEIDGLLAAGFSEASGLVSETETMEYREGGLNQFVHQLPSQTKFVPIVLKRGMALSDELWQWYTGVSAGQIVRKSGSIILLNEHDEESRRWNFYDAYPIKWSGPELNAATSEVALEVVELAHNGFKMKQR